MRVPLSRQLILWSITLLAVAFGGWLAYWGLAAYALSSSAACKSIVLHEAPSPDGRYVAAVFERGCGATTGMDRIVGLRPASQPFDPEESQDWVLRAGLRPAIGVHWTSPKNLALTVSAESRGLDYEDSWRDVKIAAEIE
jgi:hypothetical protein